MNNLDRHTLGEERREAWEKREERRETGEETEEIKETEERREAGEDIQILGLRLSEETGIGEEQQPRRLPGGGEQQPRRGTGRRSSRVAGGEEQQPRRWWGGAAAACRAGRSTSRLKLCARLSPPFPLILLQSASFPAPESLHALCPRRQNFTCTRPWLYYFARARSRRPPSSSLRRLWHLGIAESPQATA